MSSLICDPYQSTEVNCSIICSARASSIKIEVGFMLLSFFVPWSTFTASMSSIGIASLHSLHILYLTEFCRDLKPENILLDYTGHIALCDFGIVSSVLRNTFSLLVAGLCKLNMSETEKTNSGTCTYLNVHHFNFPFSILWHPRIHRSRTSGESGLYQDG